MRVPPAIAEIAPDGQLTPAQRRHILIEISKRRIRPGTGSSPEFLRRRTAMNPWPDLRPILQGIPWVVVGAVATRAYMPERATKDIDILVHLDDGDEVRERLESADYKTITALGVPGYLFHSPEGIELDVIFGEYPWIEEALANPQHDPAGYPVLDLPYLVIMKLDASRAQDTADISRMLGLASDKELNRVRATVARYAPHDLDDLESLIFLGKVEMEGVRGEEGGA